MKVHVLALTHNVHSSTPSPLPARPSELHLAAQGAQRRVDVQIFEGAAATAEDVVKHGGQVKVPSQDVCLVGLCG